MVRCDSCFLSSILPTKDLTEDSTLRWFHFINKYETVAESFEWVKYRASDNVKDWVPYATNIKQKS